MAAIRSLAALAALLLAGGCGVRSVSSADSCAAPRPMLSTHHASPGDHLTVSVNYTVACQDTNQPGDGTVTPRRYRAVRIHLVERATQTTLATVDTDRDGYLSTQVTIPATARPGDALIRVDHLLEDAALTIG